jgi:hydrogenase maturation protease
MRLKERDSRRKTLVLGLGNPLSGDDRFGARVLDLLHQNHTELPPDVLLEDAHTDLLNQIDTFAECDRVVLIDAILDPEGKKGKPGRVLVMAEDEFLSWPEASQSVHQVSPLLAVKLFRILHPAAQTQITLVGLIVDRIDQAPRYATAEIIKEGAAAVRALVSNSDF